MVVQFCQGFLNLRWDEKIQTGWIDTTQGFVQEVDQGYGWLEERVLEPFQAKDLRFLETPALKDYPKMTRYIKGQITAEAPRRLKEKE